MLARAGLRYSREMCIRDRGHPDAKKVPGVDASTGSLGQGVSIAVGMALGAKHLGKDTKVFALVGDGESQEGQIWEAYMAAAHYKPVSYTHLGGEPGKREKPEGH